MVVHVLPSSTRFDPLDDRWGRQVDDLRRLLRAEVPGTTLAQVAEPGSKGTAETIIIALGSAGVISAMVECFRLWISRDRSRYIAVTWIRDGAEETIVIDADAMSGAAMDRLVAALAQRTETRIEK